MNKDIAVISNVIVIVILYARSSFALHEVFTLYTGIVSSLRALKSKLEIEKFALERDESDSILSKCRNWHTEFQEILNRSNREWQLAIKNTAKTIHKDVSDK